MLRKTLFSSLFVTILTGCTQSSGPLSKCAETETQNLKQLTSGEYSLKVKEYVSPYYSERVHHALNAFKNVYLKERIKTLESKRLVYGGDPEYVKALQEREAIVMNSGFQELMRHTFELMFKQISQEQFEKYAAKCDNNPQCTAASDKLNQWDEKWSSKWNELHDKVERPQFKSEIKEIVRAIQEVLLSTNYEDWIALTPADSQQSLINIVAESNPTPSTNGSELRRESKDVAKMFILNLDYEMTEDLEPFPYSKIYKQMIQDERYGTYNRWLEFRLKPLAYKPDEREVAVKICQSRGIY